MGVKRIALTVFSVLGTTIAAAVVTGVAIAVVVALSGMSGIPVTIPWTIDVMPGDGAVIANASIGRGSVICFGLVAVLLAVVGRRPVRAARRRR